jgi:N-acetylglucosamine-6-sulfatase
MRAARSHRALVVAVGTAAAVVAWVAFATASSASPSAGVRAAAPKPGAKKPKPGEGKGKGKGDKGGSRERRRNAKQSQPNVIVVETDDMNQSDMQYMVQTLNLIGAQGTTFKNSYVSFPLCCPSRATFLTGQYAHNHGVRTDQRYGDLNNLNTLPVWLSNARYRTAMVGKYVNGYGVVNPREIPPGWRQWYALTANTDQKRYGYKLNQNGKVVKYPRKAKNYVTDVLNSKVSQLVKQWAPSPKPFFLWYTPTAPHGESGTPINSTRDPEPSPRYLGRMDDATMPQSPNFNEADVSDKPADIRDEPSLTQDQIDNINRRFRGRIESLFSVDDEVTRIVRALAKAKDLGKTYIMFTSDNGLQLGSHRLIFKDALYEESERVPLLIRGPQFPPGVTRDQLAANIDLAPTIVALTGATSGLNMDGTSLVPFANNPNTGNNRQLLFESLDTGVYGIRSGPWVLNQYSNNDVEMYNLDSDPYELQSQDKNPLDATIKAQLLARLQQLKTCAGASCR